MHFLCCEIEEKQVNVLQPMRS